MTCCPLYDTFIPPKYLFTRQLVQNQRCQNNALQVNQTEICDIWLSWSDKTVMSIIFITRALPHHHRHRFHYRDHHCNHHCNHHRDHHCNHFCDHHYDHHCDHQGICYADFRGELAEWPCLSALLGNLSRDHRRHKFFPLNPTALVHPVTMHTS